MQRPSSMQTQQLLVELYVDMPSAMRPTLTTKLTTMLA